MCEKKRNERRRKDGERWNPNAVVLFKLPGKNSLHLFLNNFSFCFSVCFSHSLSLFIFRSTSFFIRSSLFVLNEILFIFFIFYSSSSICIRLLSMLDSYMYIFYFFCHFRQWFVMITFGYVVCYILRNVNKAVNKCTPKTWAFFYSVCFFCKLICVYVGWCIYRM